MQTVAVTLALRSAIANVQEAVERVEGKVDRINQVLSARLKGDVIGTYRELLRVVTTTSKNGFLLSEDGMGSLRCDSRSARTLRRCGRSSTSRLATLSADKSVPKREARLESFASESGHVADVLSLIVVAEKSLQLFEYLKIQAVQSRDPALVSGLVQEVRAAMEARRTRDEELVQVLRAAIERVRLIEPLEVHRIFSKKGPRQARAAPRRQGVRVRRTVGVDGAKVAGAHAGSILERRSRGGPGPGAQDWTSSERAWHLDRPGRRGRRVEACPQGSGTDQATALVGCTRGDPAEEMGAGSGPVRSSRTAMSRRTTVATTLMAPLVAINV